MNKVLKTVNVLFKIAGFVLLFDFIVYCFGIYEPSKFVIAGNMLIVAMLLLLGELDENI